MSEYGKRGGTSAVSGRRPSVYEAVSPSGQPVKQRSYHVHSDDVMIAFHFHRNCGNGHPEGWYPNGAWPIEGAPDWVYQRYGRIDALLHPDTHVLVRATQIRVGA